MAMAFLAGTEPGRHKGPPHWCGRPGEI